MEKETSYLKYGFCKSCKKPFEFPDRVFEQNTLIKDLRCPNCGSISIFSSTALLKAIKENKSADEMMALVTEGEKQTRDLMERIRIREAGSNHEL